MIRYPKSLPRGLEILEDGLTVRKTARCSVEHTVQFMGVLAEHLIRHPDPTIVPVYQFQNLSTDRKLEYSYDMALMGMLSEDEKKLTNHYGNNYDRFGRDAFTHSEYEFTLERELPRLTQFLKELTSQFRYHDLHGGNIMIDLEGDYRIIDLEGFYYRELDHPDNNWITR